MPNFSNYKVKDKCSICPLIRCKIRCGSAPIFHLKIRSGSVHQLVDFGAKYGSVTNPKASTVAASKSTVFWTGHKSRENITNFYYVFPIYNSMLHDICSIVQLQISCILPLKLATLVITTLTSIFGCFKGTYSLQVFPPRTLHH